jgi:hypothetical protein
LPGRLSGSLTLECLIPVRVALLLKDCFGWEAAAPLPGSDASNPEICVWARFAGGEPQATARLCRCRFNSHIANGTML